MGKSEALRIIREYYPSSGKDLNEALETLIPELKVSEDERIRSSLIRLLQVGGYMSPEDKDKAFAWLAKQGEQKPAEKVESKFKVGDWVINTITKEVEQVIELTDCEYICSGHLIISFNNQHLLKRWTIDDAKDGDVLFFNDGHGNDCIELIKSITEKKIEFWFCLTNGNRYEVFDGIAPYTNLASREDATPATKEQCDLLFQKMKDAGYEWDAEKKELKKIEQKSAWSEEDEIGFRDAMWAIEQARTIAKNENDMGNLWYAEKWLKSLKERYTWKPSDEQMEALDEVYKTHSANNVCRRVLFNLINDLQKLKG